MATDEADEPTGPLLLAACKRGNISLTKTLIRDIGDDLDVNFQDGMGNSGMHYIAKGDHGEVAELLLARYPPRGGDADSKVPRLDLNLQNKKGDTIAHLCVEANHIELLKLFVEHGADCSKKNERGVDPSSYARDAEVRRILHAAVVGSIMSGGKQKKPDEHTTDGKAEADASKPVEALPAHVMKAELDPDMIARDDSDSD